MINTFFTSCKIHCIALLKLTSPTDIYVPIRSTLVLVTKNYFVSLVTNSNNKKTMFVNSDVSYKKTNSSCGKYMLWAFKSVGTFQTQQHIEQDWSSVSFHSVLWLKEIFSILYIRSSAKCWFSCLLIVLSSSYTNRNCDWW